MAAMTAALLAGFISCGNDEPESESSVPPADNPIEPIEHDFDITDSRLVFYDDFNQTSEIPDPNKWELCPQGSPAWAYYLSEKYDQAFVRDGKLVLRAEKAGSIYLTGGIQMKAEHSVMHVRVEVKAKFTKTAQGGWPAIWMMPSEPRYAGWPHCGEIDIMERVNHENVIHHVIHTNYTDNYEYNAKPTSTVTSTFNEDEYNIYAMEWDAEEMRFYVNGKFNLTYPNLHHSNEVAVRQWPFNTKFYLILNQSGGQGWPGAFTDSELPAEMQIDWVKITKL